MFEGDARTANHALQRIVSHVYRQLDLGLQPFVQSTQQGATARDVQSAAVNIRSQFGRCGFQGFKNGFFYFEMLLSRASATSW